MSEKLRPVQENEVAQVPIVLEAGFFEQEQAGLTKAMLDCLDRIREFGEQVTMGDLNRLGLTVADLKQQLSRGQRLQAIANYNGRIQESPVEDNAEGRDPNQKLYGDLLSLGLDYISFQGWNTYLNFYKKLLLDQEKRQKDKAVKEPVLFSLSDLEAARFKCGGKRLLTTINGIALMDIINSKAGGKDNLVPAFNYMLLALLHWSDDLNLADIEIGYPDTEIQTGFPLTLKKEALNGLIDMNILSFEPGGFDEFLSKKGRPADKLAQEAIDTVMTMRAEMRSTKAALLEAIVNPNSAHFNELKASMEAAIADEKSKDYAMWLLRAYDPESATRLYRSIIKLANEKDGSESGFYQSLLKAFNEYMEIETNLSELMRGEDLKMILGGETDISTEAGSYYEEIKKSANRINQKTRVKEYVLSPDKIDWGQRPAPQEIYVKFSDTRPDKFEVVLTYANEWGESNRLTLKIDTAKDKKKDKKEKSFDWSVIDDPDTLPEERQTLLGIVRSILQAIEKDVTENYDQKKQSEIIRQREIREQQRQTMTKTDGTHWHDPAYDLKKQKEENGVKETVEGLTTRMSEKKEIIKIIVPDPDNAVFKNIGHQDIAPVLGKITRHNETGSGEIEKLKRRDAGEKFVLKFAAQSNRVRILMEKQMIEPGRFVFVVLDVRYRKDLYLKNGLKYDGPRR